MGSKDPGECANTPGAWTTWREADMADRICSIDGCDNKWIARDWCASHYARWKRHGDPMKVTRTPPARVTEFCSIGDCEQLRYARTYCRSHYDAWRRHDDPLGPPPRPTITPDELLRAIGWTIVQRRCDMTPCHEWRGDTIPRGYGQVRVDGRTTTAHRLAYTTWVAPLADDELACHRCDNPPCMNPEHLFPGSALDNMTDMVTKRRNVNGERHHHVKLTDAQIEEIRSSYTGRRGEQTQLAADYGVRQSHISAIVRGEKRVRTTNPPASRP